MKVLVFVKATSNSEKGVFPPDSDKLFEEMGKFNEALVKAGIMKGGDGLKPSSAGKRIRFSDSGATTVVDGPFAETKELVAGYWIWEVKSLDEAVEWAKRCPNPMPGEEGVLEIRPVYAMEDLSEIVPAEELEREKRLRSEVERQERPRAKPKRSNKKTQAKTVKPKTVTPKRKPARAKSKK
jgi:hypothetical protein